MKNLSKNLKTVDLTYKAPHQSKTFIGNKISTLETRYLEKQTMSKRNRELQPSNDTDPDIIAFIFDENSTFNLNRIIKMLFFRSFQNQISFYSTNIFLIKFSILFRPVRSPQCSPDVESIFRKHRQKTVE